MKTFTLKTQYNTYENCFFFVGRYMADNSIAIEILNNEDGPIADLTKCLGNAKQDQSYLDTNNSPWAIDLVEELGIGYFTGRVERSGYCEYPLYNFDLEKVNEYKGD